MRMMFGGDVMLGRTVGDYILRLGPDYPLGPLFPLLHHADLVIVNLECAITARTRHWPGLPKAFCFAAPPDAAETLRGAGVGLVSLANNHTLDFGVEGLADTLAALDAQAVLHTGAGANLGQATRAAIPVERIVEAVLQTRELLLFGLKQQTAQIFELLLILQQSRRFVL